jgi:hypothetical protein
MDQTRTGQRSGPAPNEPMPAGVTALAIALAVISFALLIAPLF